MYRQLHDIICAVEDAAKQPQEPIEGHLEASPEEIDEAELMDELSADSQPNGHDRDESAESGYHLTTIQVPDPDDDLEDQGDEGLNG